MAAGRAAASRGTFDARAPASAAARALGWLIARLGVAARAAAMARLQGRGGLILELGIAAGASLGRYGPGVRLIGVDWRHGALRIAAARAARRRRFLRGNRVLGGVVLADPAALPFAAGSFDGALAAFCVAALARPAAALGELARVVRPGGDIVVVDHFADQAGAGAAAGDRRGLAMLISVPQLAMTTTRRLPPFGLFTLVCLRVERGAAGGAAVAGAGREPAGGTAPAARRRRVARRHGTQRQARPGRGRRLTG